MDIQHDYHAKRYIDYRIRKIQDEVEQARRGCFREGEGVAHGGRLRVTQGENDQGNKPAGLFKSLKARVVALVGAVG